MLDTASQLFLVLLSVLLVRFAFVVAARDGPADFLSPLVFLVTLLVFAYGVRGLLTFNDAQRYGVFVAFYDASDVRTFAYAFGAFVLGTLALIVGYASGGWKLVDRALPNLQIVSVRRLSSVAWAALLAGILVFAAFLPELMRAGAVLGLFERESRLALTSMWQGKGPFLFLLLQGSLFLLCLLHAYRIRGFTFIRVVALSIVTLLLLTSMAFLGSRQGVLGYVLTVLLFVHIQVRRIPLGVQAAAGLAAIFAGGLLGLLLDGQLRDTVADEGTFGLAIRAFARFSGTFDQFEMLSAYIQKSERFFFGGTFIEDLVLTYLPREIFPFKPEVFGTVRLQDALFPHLFEYAGLSATFPVGFFGEAYANLHVAGLIVFPFAFGCVLRALVLRARTEGEFGLYSVVVIALLSVGVGLIRGMGGSVLFIVITIFILKVLFCVPLTQRPTASRSTEGREATTWP